MARPISPAMSGRMKIPASIGGAGFGGGFGMVTFTITSATSSGGPIMITSLEDNDRRIRMIADFTEEFHLGTNLRVPTVTPQPRRTPNKVPTSANTSGAISGLEPFISLSVDPQPQVKTSPTRLCGFEITIF